MAKYKNARIEAEIQEEEAQEHEQQIMEDEPKSVDEQVWKNRYGDLRRHLNDQTNQYKQEIDELRRTVETLKTSGTQMRPPKTQEEIEAWRNTYPDFADILDTIILRRAEAVLAKERPRFKELEQSAEEIKREKALIALKKLHPDCETIFQSPDFVAWLGTQSQKHQDFIYKSTNVEDASLVLSSYKLSKMGSKDNTRAEQSSKDTAKVVRTKSSVSLPDAAAGDYWFSESQIASSDDRWFDENEAKIAEAQRKGKILMDLTGGAR